MIQHIYRTIVIHLIRQSFSSTLLRCLKPLGSTIRAQVFDFLQVLVGVWAETRLPTGNYCTNREGWLVGYAGERADHEMVLIHTHLFVQLGLLY